MHLQVVSADSKSLESPLWNSFLQTKCVVLDLTDFLYYNRQNAHTRCFGQNVLFF